jgi:hypothetical protein
MAVNSKTGSTEPVADSSSAMRTPERDVVQ